jgi:hypothetical protein
MNQQTPTGAEAGVAPSHLSMGQVLDGFFHLSIADQQLFKTIVGLKDANASSGAIVPAGHTRDPKTGKVFKIVPKKDKTQARITLENTCTESSVALARFAKENNVVWINDEKTTAQPLVADLNGQLIALVRAKTAAKAALAAYKAAHSDEFQGPPQKRGVPSGPTGSEDGGVPTNQGPAPLARTTEVRGRGRGRGNRGSR